MNFKNMADNVSPAVQAAAQQGRDQKIESLEKRVDKLEKDFNILKKHVMTLSKKSGGGNLAATVQEMQNTIRQLTNRIKTK